jgi:hypothetical protein
VYDLNAKARLRRRENVHGAPRHSCGELTRVAEESLVRNISLPAN